jgi:hypothetical protein
MIPFLELIRMGMGVSYGRIRERRNNEEIKSLKAMYSSSKSVAFYHGYALAKLRISSKNDEKLGILLREGMGWLSLRGSGLFLKSHGHKTVGFDPLLRING